MRHRFGHLDGRHTHREDFRHRGGGRRGRRKAIFDQAELQTLLLSLIAQRPRHGYELIGEVETLSNGAYSPSPGMIYPALTYMEESGLIGIVPDESARKSYRLTSEGQQRLDEEADIVETLRRRLETLASAQERADPAPVRRAMVNLKSTVLDRLSHAEVGREIMFQIVDAIDEAARKIERIEK